ncbi:MAG: CDP-diacylglycerol--serine O-phosphatidyltransferase [Chloroflexota bacterium]
MRQHQIHVPRAVIPNAVTALGVFLGYLAILYTFEGNFVAAAWLIVIAGILDLMDGRLARAVGGTSKFGGYFDSLADAINYGVAPSILFYRAFLVDWGVIGAAFSFLPTMCGAIRLARYSVVTEETSKGDFFLGLPTTVAAGFMASYVIFTHDLFGSYGPVNVAAVLLATASLLMVSEVPYEHNNNFTRRNWKAALLLVMLLTLVFFPARALFLWITFYVTMGLIRSLIVTLKDEQRKRV